MLSRSVLAALVPLTALVLAAPARADRRTALAGSQIIEDADDVWVYPQLALLHANRVGFDFGAMGGTPEYQGGGVLLLGFDSWAVGAGVHRGDLLRAGEFFAGPDADLAGLAGFNGIWDESWVQAPFAPEPAPTIADVLAAFRLGEAGMLGLRVTGGFGGVATTDSDGDERADRQGYVGFTAGYSLRGPTNVDLSVEIGWDGVKETDSIGGAAGDLADGDAILFATNGRAFFPVGSNIDIAVIGAFGVSDYEQDDIQAETVWRRRIFTGYAGAGPRVTLGERATIGSYLVIGAAHNRLKPREEDEGDDDSFTTVLTVPGLHIAGEFRVFDWLLFRAGMSAAHRVQLTSDPDGNDTESHPYDFRWHAGVGFEVDDFTFDGAFAGSFLTSGPSFLGQDTPLYGIVSVGYAWGRE